MLDFSTPFQTYFLPFGRVPISLVSTPALSPSTLTPRTFPIAILFLSLVAVSELIDYRTGMGLIARHMHIHWPYGHFGITSSLFLSMLFRSIDHKGNEPRRRVESDAVNTVVVVYLWLLNAVNVLRRRL